MEDRIIRIAYADDDASMRRLYDRFLIRSFSGRKDIYFRGFEDGLPLVEAAKNQATPFELVMTDNEMVDLDGLDACEQLRELPGYSEVPIYLITGVADPSERRELVKRAERIRVGVIWKPFDMREIKSIIERHIK